MQRIKLLILVVISVPGNICVAQTINKIIPDGIYYVVRHAEKDTGTNPALTAAGYQRAGDLYRELKNKKISRIYFTEYRRTQLTGDSLRIYQHIDTTRYLSDTTGESIVKLTGQQKGKQKNVLIIGHSNTVPVILTRLGVTGLEINIPDKEFDNLFVVTVKARKVGLKWLKYGKPSK